MSDTKFTPGPWSVVPAGGFVRRPGIDAGDNGGGETIVVFGCEHDEEGIYGRNDSESVANTNLIAAAPDLYEALEQLRVWSLDNNIVPTEIVADVEYALAKARGKS